MNFPNLQLTDAGVAAILAAVYTGSEITFTCAKIGSGAAPADIKPMTDIVTPVETLEFTDLDAGDSVATLKFQLDNSDIDNGFWLRELGIFAEVDNTTILYAYTNAGNNAVYIKKYSSDTLTTLTFAVSVAIGDAENVTAVISEAVGYATEEELEAHTTANDNPHGVTAEQVGLGNVPNVAPSDMTVDFTESSSLDAPTSGSKLSVIVGKLVKAVNTLKAHITNGDNPHGITCEQIGAAPLIHVHTPQSMGFGYGTCTTAAGTAAKVATLSEYNLIKNGIVSVRFSYDVPANATLNINNKGAKNIFSRGTKVTAGIILAGDIATFIYDGTQYHLISIDRESATVLETMSYLEISSQ